MIILEYTIKNAGRIKAVHVEPKKSGLTIIGGKNRMGKTTNLDMLAWACGGDKYRPAEPNHRGAETPAELDVKFDNGIHVTRKGKNGTLTVMDETKGTKGGQALLDKFITSFALDLRAFRQAKPKEKCDLLLKGLGIDKQLAEVQTKIDAAYDARKVANGIAKQKMTIQAHAGEPLEAPCDEPIDISGLMQQLQAANKANEERQRIVYAFRSHDADLARLNNRIKELTEELRKAKEDLAKAEATPAVPIPDEIDVAQLQADIQQATEINAEFARVQQANEAIMRATKEAIEANNATEKADEVLEKARQAKTDLLASAKMPDPDIGINEDGELAYKGDTWEALAGSDELILCAKIVSRLNPECRFILIDGLEQMDGDTLAGFDKWSEDAGFQVIGTRVTADPDEATLIIEDGQIA